MPKLINDDGQNATIENDLGQTFTIPSSMVPQELIPATIPEPVMSINDPEQPFRDQSNFEYGRGMSDGTSNWNKPGYQIIKESMVDQTPQIPKDVVAKALADPNSSLAKNYPTELKKAGEFYGLLPPAGSSAPEATTLPAPAPAGSPTPEANTLNVDSKTPVVPESAKPLTYNPFSGLDSAYKQQLAAFDRQAKIGEELAATTAGYERERQKQWEIDRAADVAKQQDRDAKYKVMFDDYNSISQEVANTKIEPKTMADVFNDKGAVGKVAGIIGILLSGMGSGMTGKENLALKAINDLIDRDVDAQKVNLQTKQMSLGNLVNKMNMVRAKFNDEDTADAAQRLWRFQVLESKFNEAASKLKGDLNTANIAQAKALLNTQRGLLEAQFNEAAQAQVQKKQAMNAAGIDFDPYEGLTKESSVERLVPEYRTTATTKEGAKELNAMIADTNSTMNGVRRLIEINQSGIGKSMDLTGRRAEADTLKSFLVGSLRLPVVGPGALSESELKLLERITANPTNFFSLDASNLTRLNALLSNLETKKTEKAISVGVQIPKAQRKGYGQGVPDYVAPHKPQGK